MARATGTRAAAIRRRAKHEQRIAGQANPLARLDLTWSMVRAEVTRHPHLLDDVIRKVHSIGVALNDLDADPHRKDETR